MAKHFVIFFFICFAGWTAVIAEDSQINDQFNEYNRNARHLHKRKRCQYEYCGGGFNFGYQGGYVPGNQYPYPPINIGISQSQSSASGGYGAGYNPYNNNQYNSQYNNQYNNQYNGYPSYQNNGYGPYNRPFYGNGYGPTNNQFNGILANTGNGYGFNRFGDEYDEQYVSDEDNARSATKKD